MKKGPVPKNKPEIDFISRIRSYGYILAVDGHKITRGALFNHWYMTIYRLVTQRRGYKMLVPVAVELMVETLTILAQIRLLTVNLHSSQLEMC